MVILISLFRGYMNFKLLKRWINAGITDDVDRDLAKPLIIINLFGTTLGIFIFIYIFVFWLLGAKTLSLLCVPISVYYLLVPLYNHYRLYRFSRFTFTLVGGFVIFLYAVSLGKESGIQYLFFLTLFTPFLVFTKKELGKRIISFFYITSLVGLLEVYYIFNDSAPVQLGGMFTQILYFCIVPTTVILEVLLIYYMYTSYIYAEVRLEDVNKSLKKTMSLLWGEMELARKIQTVLLPEKPSIRGYDVTGFMLPAKDIGGDYYDIINAGGRDWIAIGDVSGHGVSAGLIMMMAQTAIQTVVRQSPGISPSGLLEIVNRVIRNNLSRLGEEKYMTLNVLAVREEGMFMFSGLHQDILIYRHDSGKVEAVETTGMWVGLVDSLGDINRDGVFYLNKNDIVLLYTDGLTEARDFRGDIFSLKRLRALFQSSGQRPLEEIKDAILDEFKPFRSDDDVTIILAKRL